MNDWERDKSTEERWTPLMSSLTDAELEELEKQLEEMLKNIEVCGGCGKDLCNCVSAGTIFR